MWGVNDGLMHGIYFGRDFIFPAVKQNVKRNRLLRFTFYVSQLTHSDGR